MADYLIENVKDLRDYIDISIYKKTGLTAHKSRYLHNVILVSAGLYDIDMTIIAPALYREPFYLHIRMTDGYNGFYQKLHFPVITYEDVDDVLDDILKSLKPSIKY